MKRVGPNYEAVGILAIILGGERILPTQKGVGAENMGPNYHIQNTIKRLRPSFPPFSQALTHEKLRNPFSHASYSLVRNSDLIRMLLRGKFLPPSNPKLSLSSLSILRVTGLVI